MFIAERITWSTISLRQAAPCPSSHTCLKASSSVVSTPYAGTATVVVVGVQLPLVSCWWWTALRVVTIRRSELERSTAAELESDRTGQRPVADRSLHNPVESLRCNGCKSISCSGSALAPRQELSETSQASNRLWGSVALKIPIHAHFLSADDFDP